LHNERLKHPPLHPTHAPSPPRRRSKRVMRRGGEKNEKSPARGRHDKTNRARLLFCFCAGPTPLRLLVFPRPSARRLLHRVPSTRDPPFLGAFYSFPSTMIPFLMSYYTFLFSPPFLLLSLTSVIGAGAAPTPHPPSPHLIMPPLIRARFLNGPLRSRQYRPLLLHHTPSNLPSTISHSLARCLVSRCLCSLIRLSSISRLVNLNLTLTLLL